MKRHRKAGLAAAALAVLGMAACFDDPTEPLRGGPAILSLTRSSVTIRTGDSIAVEARLLDDQGNPYPPTDISWTSGDANVVAVNIDAARPVPGTAYSRAFVRGVATSGGVADVTVSAAGRSNTLRVVVLPARFPGGVTVSGTSSTDTITINQPPPTPPLVIPVTSGDTLTLVATSNVKFDSTASTVGFGIQQARILRRTADTIKVLARGPYAGRAVVRSLTFLGTATTGDIFIDSLQTDSLLIVQPRFPTGSVVVTGDTLFVNAPSGMTFNTTGSVSTVSFGTTAGVVFGRTTTQLKVLSNTNFTGGITVRNVNLGSILIDSLKLNGQRTISRAVFGGTISCGTCNLLDTVKIYATASARFTPSGASASTVTIGGQAAWITYRDADTLKVIAAIGSSSAITITNIVVGTITLPSLNSASAVNISSTTTGEANEPGNDNPATPTILAVPARSAAGTATTVVISAVNSTDIDDFFDLTPADSARIRVRLEFLGTGTGSGGNPDLDVIIFRSNFTIPAGGAGGATAVQPENATTTSLQPPAQYFVYVNHYAGGGTTRSWETYRLTVSRLYP